MDKDAQLGSTGLQGFFRDAWLDASGRVIGRSDWQKNAIAGDCRRLLAGFLRGAPSATGILGLQVGQGVPGWDALPSPPPATSAQVALVDVHPFTVPLANLKIDFLVGGVVSGTPTNRLQIVADLGPGIPTWPDAHHADITLREFGLIAQLEGAPVLINYRTHAAIAKDPASTLQRTIWLVL